MFKKFVVDTAFDSMAALSAGIDRVFAPFTRGNADLAAGCTFALALCLVVMTWEVLTGRRTVWACAKLVLTFFLAGWLIFTLMTTHPVITLWLAVTSLLLWAGLAIGRRTRRWIGLLAAVLLVALPSLSGVMLYRAPELAYHVIPLKTDRLVPTGGHAYRLRFKKALPLSPTSPDWRVVTVPSERRLVLACLKDYSFRQTLAIRFVQDEGHGLFRLKDSNIWISSLDGSNPKERSLRYFLVHPLPWYSSALHIVELLSELVSTFAHVPVVIGWLVCALSLTIRRFSPAACAGWRWLRTQRAFLVIGVMFFVGYACHQWRFFHQDSRMQMVTSRDDDGYMMERLERSHQLKSMDPYKVQNNAYGAASYYPFAFPSFVAGQLGLPITVEAINLWARGLKTVMSLALLWAVWLLAARHFGQGIAIAATLFMATNQGFLAYSSSPFYPDVCMAAFTILALGFMLDLLGRWSDRSFFLATATVGFSVAIKFFTFLLLPFLVVVCFISALRLHREQPGHFGTFLLKRAVAALVVLGGVFFLCNPFLDYNVKWLAPGWKDFYTYYDKDTSDVVVTGSGPGVDGWMYAAYLTGEDRSEAVVLVLGLLAVPALILAGWKLRGAAVQGPTLSTCRADLQKVVFLFSFAFLFQAYLFATLTIFRFIDGRLPLHILPPMLMVCGWLTCRFVPLLKELRRTAPSDAVFVAPPRSRTTTIAVIAAIVVAAAWLLPPRMKNLWQFGEYYGQAIDKSDLVDWLRYIDFPQEAVILNAMQSYIPRSYPRLYDGQWRPPELESLMFQNRLTPAVFIETENYYSIFFSPAVMQAGINTAAQLAKFNEGNAFYAKLRSNKLFPYMLAHTGAEITSTNFLPKKWVIEKYRAYTNPFAFAGNAIDRSTVEFTEPLSLPANATFAQWRDLGQHTSYERLIFRWSESTTLSLVHLTTELPDVPAFQVEIEEASGKKTMLPLDARSELKTTSTERIAHLSPPREVRSLAVSRVDGTEFTGNMVWGIRAHAPVPLAMNPTEHFFELKPSSTTGAPSDDWQSVIAPRPTVGHGVRVAADGGPTFSLIPKRRITLQSLVLVLDPIVAGGKVNCICRLEDGSEERMEAEPQHVRNPDASYFRLENKISKPVISIECTITHDPTAKVQALFLRQVAATVALAEP